MDLRPEIGLVPAARMAVADRANRELVQPALGIYAMKLPVAITTYADGIWIASQQLSNLASLVGKDLIGMVVTLVFTIWANDGCR